MADAVGDSLFQNPRFMKLWVGQGISFIGDALSAVALVILVAQITGSASAVGGILPEQNPQSCVRNTACG
jgi:hypothetical protein